jgi:hypothetical protein
MRLRFVMGRSSIRIFSVEASLDHAPSRNNPHGRESRPICRSALPVPGGSSATRTEIGVQDAADVRTSGASLAPRQTLTGYEEFLGRHAMMCGAPLAPFEGNSKGKYRAVWAAGANQETANSVWLYPVEGGAPMVLCEACGYSVGGGVTTQAASWSARIRSSSSWLSWPVRPFSPCRPSCLYGASVHSRMWRLFLEQNPFRYLRRFAGPNPSIYVYPKLTAQRNVTECRYRSRDAQMTHPSAKSRHRN